MDYGRTFPGLKVGFRIMRWGDDGIELWTLDAPGSRSLLNENLSGEALLVSFYD